LSLYTVTDPKHHYLKVQITSYRTKIKRGDFFWYFF